MKNKEYKRKMRLLYIEEQKVINAIMWMDAFIRFLDFINKLGEE